MPDTSTTIKSTYKKVILPNQDRNLLEEIQEIWRERNLLLIFAKRDISIRYKQAVVGLLWVVLQPIFMTAIYTFVFGIMAKVPSGDAPYPVFVFSGLLIWQYFSRVVLEGSVSMVQNASIITKIYFSRLLVPLGTAASASFDFLISIIVLVVLMLILNVPLTPKLFLIPAFMGAAGLLAYGITLFLSPINAIYRDIGIVLPFLIQVTMFMSPIFYPVSFVPEKFQILYTVNPIATIVESMRWAIIGSEPPSLVSYIILMAFIVVLLFYGFKVFRKLEATLVDRV